MNSHDAHGDTNPRHGNTDTPTDFHIDSDVSSQVGTDTPVFDAMVQALAGATSHTAVYSSADEPSTLERTRTASDTDLGTTTVIPAPDATDGPIDDWVDQRHRDPSTPSPVIDPDSPEGAAILSLFRRIKDVEHSDGNWPSGDVANEVTEWLTELGIDPNQHPTDAARALRTAWRERPGRGPDSSTYGVRIATNHHDPEELIRTALHILARQLGPGTSVELVSHDRELLARIEHPGQTLTPGS